MHYSITKEGGDMLVMWCEEMGGDMGYGECEVWGV